MASPRPFHLIGAAYGLGSMKHGAWKGPSAFRHAGILDRLRTLGVAIEDTGDVVEPEAPKVESNPKLRFLDPFLSFHAEFSNRLLSSYRSGALPLILGGDHAISISSIATAAAYLRELDSSARLGVIWVDTHPDINTPETTPSGNLHGMTIAVSLGLGDPRLCNLMFAGPKVAPASIAYVGLRDIDSGERPVIHELDIKTYTMSEVDRMGALAAFQEARRHVERSASHIIVSFDLDACDPALAPGVGTPFPGGLTYREARSIMEEVSTMQNLLSLELVELNPELDLHGATCRLGMDLLEFALGRRYL